MNQGKSSSDTLEPKLLDKNFDLEDDFIGAYFKQRCSRSTNQIFKGIESDDDSSLGVLDVDNLSELDDMEKTSMDELKDGLTTLAIKDLCIDPRTKSISGKNSSHNFHSFTSEPTKSELSKQRELAKKTLMQINHKLGNIPTNGTSSGKDSECNSLHEVDEKTMIGNSASKGKSNNWFEYIQSPQTPRFFKDELGSVNGSSANVHDLGVRECSRNIEKLNENGAYDFLSKKKLMTDIIRTSSEFFPETVDTIRRLEEDEKKFKQEQSGISNNSEISQFSGIVEGSGLPHLSELLPVEVLGKDKISIGKYFELRSHSINSLVGSKNNNGSSSVTIESDPIMLQSHETRDNNMENERFDSLVNSVELVSCIQNSKVSDTKFSDIKRFSEASLTQRHSDESCESASILLIQNLLHSMDPILSGTQINDRLLECLNKMKIEKGNESSVCAKACRDMPKSSKTVGKLEIKKRHSKVKTAEPMGSNLKTDMHPKKATEVFENKVSSFNGGSLPSSIELKENLPQTPPPSKMTKTILSLRNEYVGKGRRKGGFDCSTPKIETQKSEMEKFKLMFPKLPISDKDWEAPPISSILKLNSFSGNAVATVENDKTLLNSSFASSESETQNKTITVKDTFNIENRFADGDLTLLSEHMAFLNKESLTNNKFGTSNLDDISADIKELVTYPKGSVDCSALLPVLQEKFPELLLKIAPQLQQMRHNDNSEKIQVKMNDSTATVPGSWVRITAKYDYKDSYYLSLGNKKLLPITIENLTGNSLIVSLDSPTLECSTEKHLSLFREEDEFMVGEYGSLHMKDTLVLPKGTSLCKIYVKLKLTEVFSVKLKLRVKRLRENDVQVHYKSIPVIVIFPEENIALLPENEINFGTIPNECTEKKLVFLVFDGICDLPIKIFINKSQCFSLNSVRNMDKEESKNCIWQDNKYSCILRKGGKTTLELKIKFTPLLIPEDAACSKMDATGTLIVALDLASGISVLLEVPISGSTAIPKFLCNNSCVPLLFQASEPDQLVKRLFPLKNVGPIDLEFSLHIADESKVEPNDGSFFVPKTFILKKGEESSIEIIFSAKTCEKKIRRLLVLHMQPNGNLYDVELIGIVMARLDSTSTSRSSSGSGSTSTIENAETLPFQMKSTTSSLSWPAVSSDSDVKQTFHVMNTSGCNAVARFSFRWDTSSFRFLNEKGEMVEKLKKLLKPNCSNAMTLVFRPDSVGPHRNSIMIETNCLYGKRMISLNGFGGSPKIFMKKVKFDLNGSRIVRLVNSESESQVFQATIEFTNRGNVAGFISISKVTKVLSLSSELHIEPSNFVLSPSSKREVKISQKLKNDDVKRMLSGRDIGKIATITVTTGDEPSRFRMRKLICEKKISCSEPVNSLIREFSDEKYVDVSEFDDEKWFHNVFLKYLDTTEITAVIERPIDTSECTIFDDFEETVKEFVTVLPASDNNNYSDSTRNIDKLESSDTAPKVNSNPAKNDWSFMYGESSKWRDQKIAKWLEDSHKQEL